MDHLLENYDGWAIATAADCLTVYAPLPTACRVMVWCKPNATPGPHRIQNSWEPVILYPPRGRRGSRGGAGQVRDFLVASSGRGVRGVQARGVDAVGP